MVVTADPSICRSSFSTFKVSLARFTASSEVERGVSKVDAGRFGRGIIRSGSGVWEFFFFQNAMSVTKLTKIGP